MTHEQDKLETMQKKLVKEFYHMPLPHSSWWHRLASFVLDEKAASYRDGLITGQTPDAMCGANRGAASSILCQDESGCTDVASFIINKKAVCAEHRSNASQKRRI